MKQFQALTFLALVWLSSTESLALCQDNVRHPADSLLQLNLESRAFYAKARAEVLAKSSPIILLSGDTLVLRDGEQRTTVSLAASQYDELKTFSHVPLALDVALISAEGTGPLSDAFLEQLRSYRSKLQQASGQIENSELSTKQADRQRAIVSKSLQFIDSLLQRGACDTQQRQAYVREMTPLVMANTQDAARATLLALDKIVRQWKSKMTDDQWRRLKVVVMGKQLPRQGSLAVQYFAKLLEVPGEGERIIYAESISDEAKALDLLGTHILDTQVGIDFFNDPQRMKRDILSDAARDYLPQLLPEHAPPEK